LPVHVKRLNTITMKRLKDKVPGFDEIIFENRNKEYGAYDLRKRYKSVTSISILTALAFFITIVIVSFLTTEEGTASTGPETIIIAVMDNYDPSLVQPPVETKPPPELTKAIQNVIPDVVTDTTEVTSFIPITEDLIITITDGDVNDVLEVIEEPVETADTKPEPFVVVEEPVEFPGGNTALLDFIAKNIIYPGEALNNNIQGRVILKFVVEPDGSVGRIEILKGVDPLIDQEAVRVVGTLPKFKPGKQNGLPVPVWFMVPVTFQIVQ
jgi:protein TonB